MSTVVRTHFLLKVEETYLTVSAYETSRTQPQSVQEQLHCSFKRLSNNRYTSALQPFKHQRGHIKPCTTNNTMKRTSVNDHVRNKTYAYFEHRIALPQYLGNNQVTLKSKWRRRVARLIV